jgi:putative endonuclease
MSPASPDEPMPYCVHLLASRRHGTLYLGVTNNGARGVDEHQRKLNPGFSARQDVSGLVRYEGHERIDEAIARENSLKTWRRDWTIALSEDMNPDWSDLPSP